MVRADRDRWDLATSVGATATMVAAQRALAADPRYALIDDPYAAPLVRAVGMDVYTRLVADPRRGGFRVRSAANGHGDGLPHQVLRSVLP